MAHPDPDDDAPRRDLGVRLVDLESSPVFDLARDAAEQHRLIGTTKRRWATAVAEREAAWDAYNNGDHAQVEDAHQLVTAVESLVEQLRHIWVDDATRINQAKTAARDVGDGPTTARADELLDRANRDPLSLIDDDAVDRLVTQAATVAALPGELRHAQRELEQLDADIAATRTELEHWYLRIAGLADHHPVPGSTGLSTALARITRQSRAGHDGAGAAAELSRWRQELTKCRATLDAARATATSAGRKRDALRGEIEARRAQASAQGQDEDKAVPGAIAAVHHMLQVAPCDVDLAEKLTGEVARILAPHRLEPDVSPHRAALLVWRDAADATARALAMADHQRVRDPLAEADVGLGNATDEGADRAEAALRQLAHVLEKRP